MESTKKDPVFYGPLAQLFTDFINYKRLIGRKYISEALRLKEFDNLTIKMNHKSNILSREIVNEFVKFRPMESHRNNTIRRILMKQFAKYLIGRGYEAYLLADLKVKTKSTFTPYIFSDIEISNFFNTLDKLKPRKISPYMHLVLPVLFRILYGCGLRISEALNLKLSDVDLKQGILTIKNSKNDTDRLIPMSKSLQNICLDYFNKLHHGKTKNHYFFPSHKNGNIIRQNIIYHFRKLHWKSGIAYGGKGKGPRLHDFRHTFAVHSLRKNIKEGKDIYTTLPILSAYLGHKSIQATQRYLRLTADVYPDILELVEKTSKGIFPEVDKNETI